LDDDDNENDDTLVSWERLSTSITPPGRNAATLTPLPAAPCGCLSSMAKNDDDDADDDDDQYFLLSGGWYPFQTTHADTFVLKVSSK
jgi:hypothetical protein